MTDHVDQGNSRKKEHRRRIRGWHAPQTQDDAPPVSFSNPRTRNLLQLVPLWPSEIDANEPGAATRVVAALERALRGERRRGRAGHWSYVMNRHVALARALRQERARLANLRRARTVPEKVQAPGVGGATEKKCAHIWAM